jgi:hypothetical protein
MTDAKQRRYFVPAQRGYWRLELVNPHAPDGEFKVYREPIVAWELRLVARPNMNSFAHPVTVEWHADRNALVAILYPDGVVRLTNGTSFASQAEWLAHAADDARAREEA